MSDEGMLVTEFSKLNEDEKKQVLSFIETLKKRNTNTTNSLNLHPTFSPTEAFF